MGCCKNLAMFAVVAATLVVADQASADGWRIASPLDIPESRIYLDIEGGALWQSLPTWTFGNHPGTTTPYYSYNATATGPDAGFALGYRPQGGLMGLGHNERVEVSGDYFGLEDRTTRGRGPVNVNDLWNPVGGGGALVTGGVFSASTDTQQYGGELALRLATDIDLSPGFAVTPAVAIFGALARRTVDYSDLQQCSFVPTTACFDDQVNEALDTRQIGLGVSAGSRYMLGGGFALLAGGGAALVGTRSTLHASDCFDENSAAAGCQPLAAIPSTETSAKRSRTDIGARLEGQLGIRYILAGNATIDLLGGLRYDSAVPSIRNPTSATQTVSLGSSGQLGETVILRASFPFGR